MKIILKQLRWHQWTKNLLVAIPFWAAHRWTEPEMWIRAAFAFVAFSALASSVYIFNDLCDLENDRAHPLKKHRPLASGALSVGGAVSVASFLIFIAGFCTWSLSGNFWVWALGYLLLNALYSMRLKAVHSLDIVCLASLYTLRILAGGEATQVDVSHWLLSFSAFLFLSLALVKRVSELLKLDEGTTKGRDYSKGDVNVLMALGASSAYATVLVLALYLRSPEVTSLYSRPNLLWALTPLSIYWLTRLWILTMRGKVHEDPVIFALKDPVGWLTLFAGVACLVFAT